MWKIYQQWTIADRTMIRVQLEMGTTPSAIATGLNRSASTITREFRRNNLRPETPRGHGRPPIAGNHRFESAQKRARAFTVEPEWNDDYDL